MTRQLTIDADNAALVVVDVQEKIFANIGSTDRDRLLNRIERVIAVSKTFELPVLWTEQYPEGLGATLEPIRNALPPESARIVKTTCSCWRDDAFRRALQLTGREHVIVIGIETHVCIQQTVLDLLRVDYVPFVPADACGSRFEPDALLAAERMRAAGAQVTSVESLLFELVQRCDHPKFKDVLKLVK